MISTFTQPPGARARIYRAPEAITSILGRSVFLSGSIEPGGGERWHLKMIRRLQYLPVTIIDPWREDWDSSWINRKFDERFATQTRWELANLRRADVVAVYFAPGSDAMVSLLELGLSLKKKPVVVCCPEGYNRREYVEIVCEEQDTDALLVATFEEFVQAVAQILMVE